MYVIYIICHINSAKHEIDRSFSSEIDFVLAQVIILATLTFLYCIRTVLGLSFFLYSRIEHSTGVVYVRTYVNKSAIYVAYEMLQAAWGRFSQYPKVRIVCMYVCMRFRAKMLS